MCILSVYTLLKVLGYYDFSVCPGQWWVSKKVWMGVGGWGELCPSLFWIFGIVLTLQRPLGLLRRKVTCDCLIHTFLFKRADCFATRCTAWLAATRLQYGSLICTRSTPNAPTPYLSSHNKSVHFTWRRIAILRVLSRIHAMFELRIL